LPEGETVEIRGGNPETGGEIEGGVHVGIIDTKGLGRKWVKKKALKKKKTKEE